MKTRTGPLITVHYRTSESWSLTADCFFVEDGGYEVELSGTRDRVPGLKGTLQRLERVTIAAWSCVDAFKQCEEMIEIAAGRITRVIAARVQETGSDDPDLASVLATPFDLLRWSVPAQTHDPDALIHHRAA